MKQLALLLAVVAVGVWAFSYALAGDGTGDAPKPKAEGAKDAPKGDPKADGPKKDGEKGALRGEQARMAEVCGLTDDQQKKIADLNAAQQKEIQEIVAKY